MIEPREYQSRCIEIVYNNFFKKNDQLVSLPTASGKTIIFTLLLKKCLEVFPELKACVLVNQVKLVTQTQDKLKLAIDETKTGLYCGTLGEYNEDNEITVASIDTIWRSPRHFNVIIVDECHNADHSARYQKFLADCLEINPKLKIVRFTATPFTSKGFIFGEDKPNKSIDFQIRMDEMINMKFIVAPKFTAPEVAFDVSGLKKRGGDYLQKELEDLTDDEEKIADQVEDAMKRLSGRKKVVWCCTSIRHAEIVQNEVRKYEDCAIIHSKLSKREQQFELASFEKFGVRHISSVTMVSEGFDFPEIDAIVAMRPTRSPVLYVQLVGRGLRLFPGKEDCLFLDYGHIVENLGTPWNPAVNAKNDKKTEAELKCLICPSCRTINFLPRKTCSDCGFEFFDEEKPKKEHAKNLSRFAADWNFGVKEKITFELPILGAEYDPDYVSKKGHDCLKCTFTTMKGPIYKYFKRGSKFHLDFLRDRKLMGDPTLLIVERNGKWLNAKEIKWKK